MRDQRVLRNLQSHAAFLLFFFNDTATTEIYTLSLHDALPILLFNVLRPVSYTGALLAALFRIVFVAILAAGAIFYFMPLALLGGPLKFAALSQADRSEEHTSELQSPDHLVCRLLLEKKNTGLRRSFPELSGNLQGLPRVVIVGAGFGGIACARALRHAPASITLIDRHNYRLFQPLLYQVATAALSPADIAIPIRAIFRDQFNAKVMLATVTGLDTERREVLADGLNLPYDYLVIATGATHSYFGHDTWAPFAPGLKRVDDATLVRRRVLEAFEHAEVAASEAERRRQLSFVIVGGGPTGVELAGAIAELARVGMEKDFRNFDPASPEIILVQAGPPLVPAFP